MFWLKIFNVLWFRGSLIRAVGKLGSTLSNRRRLRYKGREAGAAKFEYVLGAEATYLFEAATQPRSSSLPASERGHRAAAVAPGISLPRCLD